jgi:hypothetical protein
MKVKQTKLLIYSLSLIVALAGCGGGGGSNIEKTHNTKKVRPVNESPILTLKGGNRINLYEGEKFKEPGYTAVDKEGGDLTSKVEVEVKKL